MKKILLLTCLNTIFNFCYSQYAQTDWVNIYNYQQDSRGYDIIKTIDDHLVVTGTFTDSLVFSTGNPRIMLTSQGGKDAFIVKLDTTGLVKWAIAVGGKMDDNAASITSDSSGNIYAIGAFKDTVDFDPGPGSTSKYSSGGEDIFVLKLNAGGDFRWVKTIGAGRFDFGTSIEIDNASHILITGNFTDTVDFDPDSGVYYLYSSFNQNNPPLFVAKLDSNGTLIWAQRIYGEPYDITPDQNNSIYVAGKFSGSVDFDPSNKNNSLSANSIFDWFIFKWDNNGKYKWAKKSTASGGSGFAEDITIDPAGNVLVTGLHRGSGSIVKYDKSGNVLSVKNNSGASYGYSVMSDNHGNIYNSGWFRGTMKLGNSTPIVNQGYRDGYILKYDSSWNNLYLYHIPGTDLSYPKAITVINNSVYITGYYSDSADFNYNTSASSMIGGGSALFIFKISDGKITWLPDNPSSNHYNNLYPNPSSGHITLDFGDQIASLVDIYNIQGKLITSLSNVKTQHLTLNVPAGLYLINAHFNNEIRQFKMIVE
jgi:hypothetical protein